MRLRQNWDSQHPPCKFDLKVLHRVYTLHNIIQCIIICYVRLIKTSLEIRMAIWAKKGANITAPH